MGESLVWSKLRQSLEENGLLGTFEKALGAPVRFVRDRIEASHFRSMPPSEFDLRHGVDTSNPVFLRDLHISSKNVVHSGVYWPCPVDAFQGAMHSLPIDFSQFIFVDYGSGKGKAILMASEFPFRRIIGIDFSRELNEVARANILKYKSDTQRCRHIDVVEGDFAEFPLPPENTIVFMYDPCDESLMKQILAAMEASLARHPRQVYVIYKTARFARLFAASPYFSTFAIDDKFSIYKSTAAAPLPMPSS